MYLQVYKLYNDQIRGANPMHVRKQQLVDAHIGNALIEVKFATDALRTIRTSIMQVAYAMAEYPDSDGYLVLVESGVTEERLREEWGKAAAVLRPEVANHLTVCLMREGHYLGIPRPLSPGMERVLDDVVQRERANGDHMLPRPAYSLIIFKLLLQRWVTNGEPVTADWLARTAGCSYPTVARAVDQLGSLVHRTSDRRMALRYFPREEFSRLVANSDNFRSPARYADRTGQTRPPEAHIRRLEKLKIPKLAIGGVLGARHYDPDLDLVGTPRLDLSLHAYGPRANLDFITRLDPALRLEDDPLQPANVVVHFVRQKDPLFTPREQGLLWADPVECLLDLHEARLEMQASQFLDALKRDRSKIT